MDVLGQVVENLLVEIHGTLIKKGGVMLILLLIALPACASYLGNPEDFTVCDTKPVEVNLKPPLKFVSPPAALGPIDPNDQDWLKMSVTSKFFKLESVGFRKTNKNLITAVFVDEAGNRFLLSDRKQRFDEFGLPKGLIEDLRARECGGSSSKWFESLLKSGNLWWDNKVREDMKDVRRDVEKRYGTSELETLIKTGYQLCYPSVSPSVQLTPAAQERSQIMGSSGNSYKLTGILVPQTKGGAMIKNITVRRTSDQQAFYLLRDRDGKQHVVKDSELAEGSKQKAGSFNCDDTGIQPDTVPDVPQRESRPPSSAI